MPNAISREAMLQALFHLFPLLEGRFGWNTDVKGSKNYTVIESVEYGIGVRHLQTHTIVTNSKHANHERSVRLGSVIPVVRTCPQQRIIISR
jgi:hypothetical protein